VRLGLNLLHLVPGETGGSELYARRLVEALVEAEPELQPTLFVAREAAGESWPAGVEVRAIPVRGRSRVARVLAEQTLLPAAVALSKIELLHNLFTTAPAVAPCPQVTTIHDLIYKRLPDAHAGFFSHGLSLLVSVAARRSRRVIAPSEATKEDLVRFLGIPPNRVDVTYEGPGLAEDLTPVGEGELRRRFDLGDAPIVLTVSAKRPHKNLERLFAAFARVQATPSPMLVAPGYETVFEPKLRRSAGERVRITGWVDDATLEGLYRVAACFVLPSLAEGFGLPVLEAMARGVPVTCSNATSLPEVAGNAALYFDPTDTEAIAQAIGRLLTDEALRAHLAAAGREQAKRFSWEATARETLASYELALAQA
jgi:glycosyltransferase involved in cell wall biosynthesis